MTRRRTPEPLPTATHDHKINWPWFILGCVLLAAALVAFFWAFSLDYLSPSRRFLLMWLLPLASGFGCGCFAGSLKVSGPLGNLAIAATGGFAVWILSHFLLPKIPDTPPAAAAESPALGQASRASTSPGFVTFSPIPQKETRVRTFRESCPPQGLSLRFLAPAWELDFGFFADPQMSVGELHAKLLRHFEMEYHVKLDPTKFPADAGIDWTPQFLLLADGKVISESHEIPDKRSIQEWNVRPDAVLRVRVDWRAIELLEKRQKSTIKKIRPPEVSP